ncbi:hypothetical protein OQA88_2947 [Cercophora sp. LCS_1]
MAALTQLPTELLLQICYIVSSNYHSTGQADLSRLSRTCRRLLSLVQPLVFTVLSRNEIPRATQIKLLRTLHSRPDLALHLQYLSISSPYLTSYEPDLVPSDMTYIANLFTSLNLSLPSQIANLTPESLLSSPTARLFLIELILLHTPNLTHLHLPFNTEWELPILSRLAKQKPVGSNLLPKLRHLHISHYYISGDRFDVPFHEIISLCAMAQGVEELWTYNPGSDFGLGSGNEGGGVVYPLRKLKRLEFDDVCGVNEELLYNMVESAPELEVFGLVWNPAGDTYNWSGEGTVADVWKALGLRRETLREVRLDVLRSDDDLEVGRLGWWSLEGFVKLEVLKMGEFALDVLREAWRERRRFLGFQGVDDGGFVRGLLPRRIKEVTLWEPDGALVGGMKALAEAVRQGEYPDLKQVVVAPPDLMSDRWYDGWAGESEWSRASAHLRKAFARSGVVFEVQTERVYGVLGPSWERCPPKYLGQPAWGNEQQGH